MKKYLFAKSFDKLSQEELMQLCAELGVDGPTMLIREGYWTTEDDLTTIPKFIKAAESFGLEVKYADTSIIDDSPKSEELFAILAENGIEKLRLGFRFRPHGREAVRALADDLVDYAERMAKLSEKYGVLPIMQIHGWMYPQSATAAYAAIKHLDPKHIGVKMDPGNNYCQEGYEYFDYQVDLLGEYIAALGVKNAVFNFRHGKWLPMFTPAHAGIADYKKVYGELNKIGFDGPTIMMPLYEAKDVDEYKQLIKEELAYVDECSKTVL